MCAAPVGDIMEREVGEGANLWQLEGIPSEIGMTAIFLKRPLCASTIERC